MSGLEPASRAYQARALARLSYIGMAPRKGVEPLISGFRDRRVSSYTISERRRCVGVEPTNTGATDPPRAVWVAPPTDRNEGTRTL